MIIDSQKEFIALQEQEYRDLRYLAQVFASHSQEIALHFHKSGMIFMAEVNKQITKATEQAK